jgi:hypothetical protein
MILIKTHQPVLSRRDTQIMRSNIEILHDAKIEVNRQLFAENQPPLSIHVKN